MHKMNEDKLVPNIGTQQISCDRGSGAIYVGRERVGFVKVKADKDPMLVTNPTACTKLGIDTADFLQRATAAMQQ